MELTGTENAVYEGADVPLDDATEDSGHFTGDGALDQAVEELGRRREAQARERPRAEEPEDEDPTLTKVRWVDGRDPNKPITTAEAARDYGQYRETLARQILEGTQAAFDADQAAEAQAAQPEQTEGQTQEQTAEEHWNSYYQNLAPEAKAQITSAIELQQKSALVEQEASTYALALEDLLLRLNGAGAGSFGDIRTVEDAQRLQATDPARFAALQQHSATVTQVRTAAAKVQEQRQAQQAAAFQESYKVYAAEQDRAAERVIPELSANADPESQRRLMRGTIENLREVGFSDRELQAAWVQGAPLYLRDARAQKIIADAARWRMANSREARNDLRSKRVHTGGPVQRPGVSVGYETTNERALSEKLAKQGDIHTAVKLLQARRASRR
jgi:hypothetical protein